MKFNSVQQEALSKDTIKKNVLISAGAGSGKTAVLTEKVYDLIKNYNVNIDELLVLTFTDAASFQMKERIIKRMRKEDEELANKLYSAHIQTFDSFTSFLVKKYNDRLEINPNFKIVDENIVDGNIRGYLDEVLDEYYKSNNETLKKALRRFCYKNDQALKDLIINLYNFLDKLNDVESKDFIENYEKKYLSKDYVYKIYSDYLDSIMKDIEKEGKYFSYSNVEEDKKGIEGFDTISSIYKNIKTTYESRDFDNLFLIIKEYAAPFRKNDGRYTKMSFESRMNYDSFHSKLGAYSSVFKSYPSPSSQYELLNSFKDIYSFLFEIEEKIRNKINELKNLSSSYTYQDVSKICLNLLLNPKYKDVQEEISSLFKYCLIDEYQDTNDIQETFLNFMSKNSYLFVVGDIKQSIYRFRFSNPKLFNNRKFKYLNENEISKVVEMNINYRSVKKILDYSNIFFKFNMSIEKGDVDFNDNEKLHYDEDIILYDDSQLIPSNDYGFNILRGNVRHIESNLGYEREEILIIINDILDKINNKYQVIDKNEDGIIKYRNCNFGDFAIITRRKRNFSLYQDLFLKYNIPLNIVFDEDIRDINSVILIESLLNAFLVFQEDDIVLKRYYFTSLARSYLYSYNDKDIYDLIKNDGFLNDPIVIKIKDFIKKYKDSSISEIFLNLINEFGIIEKLYRLGDINNNINKIEYIYTLIKSMEDSGQSLEDFLGILANLDSNDMTLTGNNLIKNNNSVELTTIHASKGLEYKIVYLSSLDSNYKYRNDNNDNILSKDFGFLLDDHVLSGYKKSFLRYIYELQDKKDDYSEYVRLIYVALTRPKESIYFVNPFFYSLSNASTKTTCIGDMLKNAFNYEYHLNFDLVNDHLIKVIDDKEVFNDLDYLINVFNDINSEDYLTNAEKKKNVKEFEYQNIVDDINSRLFSKYVIYNFNKKYEVKPKDINRYINSKDDEVGIKDRKDFFEKLITSIVTRIVNYYILSTFESNEEEIRENGFLDKNYINMLGIKFDKACVSSRTKFSQEDLLIYAYLLSSKEYLPLVSMSLKDKNIKEKNLSIDKNIEAYDSFLVEVPILEINDFKYDFKENKKLLASSKVEDKDIYQSGILEEGILYHKLLELVDFKSKDTSFIQDSYKRKIIDKVLKLDIFDNLNDSKIFKEYEYVEDNQKGIIDLLIVFKDHIYIIDYKTKNIDEKKYHHQLETYYRNINRLFKVNNIKTFLVSIKDGVYEEVSI